MNWDTPAVIVAIISVSISFITIFFNITSYFNRNKGRLKVRITALHELSSDDFGKMSNLRSLLDIKVTNVGYITRDIDAPIVILKHMKINNVITFSFYNPKLMYNFPIEIQAGKRFVYNLPIHRLIEKVTNKKGNSKLRIQIVDTYGKKYYSNWISYEKIVSQFNSELELREQTPGFFNE